MQLTGSARDRPETTDDMHKLDSYPRKKTCYLPAFSEEVRQYLLRVGEEHLMSA